MSGDNLPATLPVERMSDLQTVGEAIAASGMFGVKNAASGLVVAATCHQQGITLMEFVRTFHIIEGRPSMRADAMLAEFRKRGGKYRIIENSATKAEAEFAFEGHKYTFSYTIEDAHRTGDALKGDGKVKDIWKKRPDDMLWARLVSRSVRRIAPEIVAGLYTPEEVQDFAPDRNAEPVALEPNDAQRRVSKAIPVEDPITPDLCPIGGPDYVGKRWQDMDTELLNLALQSDDPAMTHEHKERISIILESREAWKA